MSIFEALSPKRLAFPNFWVVLDSFPDNLKSKEVVYQGELGLSPHEFVLMTQTKKYLYYTSSENQFFLAYIEWFQFCPFTEEIENSEIIFGFTLKSKDFKKDFYLKSEKELELWISSFSQRVIMTHFDDYFVVIKNIDSGQFGEVNLCENIETHEEFAVKKVRKTILNSLKTLNCLYNEIRIQRKLDHQNIVKLFHVYEDSQFVYMVMEYIKEGNLYKRIAQSKNITKEETKVFTKNLIETLSLIHSKGIIHRDIKPENILMTSKESIFPFKIADFGLACFFKQHETTCAGSPGYMAPEMLRGETYNLKIDFFSIGVIVFILLTGFTPFGANSTKDTIAKNLKCQIPFNSSYIKKLPIQARSFLKKILNPDPDLRPNSADLLTSEFLRLGPNIDLDNTSTTVKVDFQKENYSFSKAAANFSPK